MSPKRTEGPRLQRYLAEAGVAARRKAEELIVAGRVRVNGRVAELGSRVDADRDRVEVDGRPIVVERKVYLLLHKPRGCVSTLSDPEGRPTVMELLPKQGPRVYPVGRLDFNTEGLLLFTNDGDLANGLMHPRRAVPKTYHAKTRGLLNDGDVAALEAGVELDGAVRKASVAGGGTSATGKHSWIELTITEGRNRQIHRMMESIGQEVSRLIRVGYGPLTTDGLLRGKWRHLTAEELTALRVLAGLALPRVEGPKASKGPRGPRGREGREVRGVQGRPASRGAEPAAPRRGGPDRRGPQARRGTPRRAPR